MDPYFNQNAQKMVNSPKNKTAIALNASKTDGGYNFDATLSASADLPKNEIGAPVFQKPRKSLNSQSSMDGARSRSSSRDGDSPSSGRRRKSAKKEYDPDLAPTLPSFGSGDTAKRMADKYKISGIVNSSRMGALAGREAVFLEDFA